jgi:hypothetical protein
MLTSSSACKPSGNRERSKKRLRMLRARDRVSRWAFLIPSGPLHFFALLFAKIDVPSFLLLI